MADPGDFAPGILRVQERPPSPLGRKVLWTVLALFATMLAWALVGRLDVVAVAEGKLVPASYLKIVQPAEQGVVKEILVQEGEQVRQGQVLIRMDAALAQADVRAMETEYHTRRLTIRRIDAQLQRKKFQRNEDDPEELFLQVEAQQAANVQAYENALAQERSLLEKARHDLAAAEQTRAKLAQVLPHYVEQERAFDKLSKDGFAGRILATDKARERIEKEQDLRTQEFIIRSNTALIAQSERRLAQIGADYRRQLQTERVEVGNQLERVRQELAKIAHRHGLLELKAPADGVVKDLATHTAGTVAAPGTILMTLVPRDERMVAEVWVGNHDVGFVRGGQPAKVKLAPFQFQKYGMIEGRVKQVSADATEAPSANTRSDALTGRDRPMGPLAYRALVELDAQALDVDGTRYRVSPGMQVAAEIHLGTRTVMEYLLSPVRKAFHEAARER
ncbi:MAG TPA: HlyD family type I secretion periplasmic adaptor subunit [Burkholderiales bacterium]|nr:HlyD family type I secretion periplasmic adaptor subunit [Burkholderiales bacterium]